MALIEIGEFVGSGEYMYVDSEPVEISECVTFEATSGDQVEALRNYLIPLLEKSKGEGDEVAEFILHEMDATWSGDLGNAVGDALEHFPEWKVKRIQKWITEAQGAKYHVYIYVSVGEYRLAYGLVRTKGGPRDPEVGSKRVGGYESEQGFAPYWGFADALREIERSAKRAPSWLRVAFEENPLVEVDDEEDYYEALVAMGLLQDGDRDEWRRINEWKKPGLYDFSNEPPTYSGTVEEYKREASGNEAEHALEMMWEEDLEEACTALIEE